MTPAPICSDTVDGVLRRAAQKLSNSNTPLLDARVLLKYVAAVDDAGVIARANEKLSAQQHEMYFQLIERRAKGEPIAYIIGVKEFWSLEFDIEPGVLIPREDSECLIEAAATYFSVGERLSILDLGTGSGCLLCALLTEFPQGIGLGVDSSKKAIEMAKRNAQKLGLTNRASFVQGEWFSSVSGKFDLIIANPPYIREGDRQSLPRDVFAYEPGEALFAGEDGLDAYRAIFEDASHRLADDGMMIFEMGADQSESLLEMVTKTFPRAKTGLIHDLQRRPRGIFIDRRAGAKKD